jgi:DNA mismatch endonuclease, patch repair protein
MADVFTKAKRSAVMSRIRSRGNKDTELALVRLLRAHKISGWRRQVEVRGEKAEGRGRRQEVSRTSHLKPRPFRVRPDFVFKKLRTVIFVDGCFWHGCPQHATKPKHNREFWRRKFSANKARDELVTRALRRAGWRVLRVWEHELARKNAARLVRRIQKTLTSP